MPGNGLEGVVATTTALSEVDGERGELVIAGYQVDELAERATFEETTWLLWHGDLPEDLVTAGIDRLHLVRAEASDQDAATVGRDRQAMRRWPNVDTDSHLVCTRVDD